jgi:hypothetical protein
VDESRLFSSRDAEEAVLGAMLMGEPLAVAKARDLIDESAFEISANRFLFRAIVQLSAEEVAIDPITVTSQVEKNGDLEAIGGRDRLTYLLDVVPTAGNIEYHARLVCEAAGRRRVRDLGRQLIRESGEPDFSVPEILAAHQEAVSNAALQINARGVDEPKVFQSVATLSERPDLLLPPQCAVPRLGFQGRTTLIVCPDKGGKTTLAAHAATEVSRRGTFLSEQVVAVTARVMWAGLEEAIADPVRRFNELGAARENIQMVVIKSANLLADIRAELTERPADLFVLDSLTEYARVTRGAVPDDGDSAGWAGVIRPLVALTREFPALCSLILHHPRRSDGQFRGSGEIAAAVDCLLEMRPPKESEYPTLRHISGRARWDVPAFDIRLVDGRYELAGGATLSVDTRVLIQIDENRGVSMGELRRLVGGRGKAVDEAVEGLVRRGAILDLGSNGKHAYHPAAVQRPPLGLL